MTSSFFALFDDIVLLMDDVASMTKIATKKTAGILGDDLAVNAEKSSGFLNKRELPVLWKITKGSFLNKLIILPVAFLLSTFVPLAVTIILLFGGLYLAYEGAHKVYHTFFHSDKKQVQKLHEELNEDDYQVYENTKVKSALLVDFILSIEIIIIALSTVTEAEMMAQIFVVSFIAILATVGVYGVVALIVRMDDVGYRMIKSNSSEFSTRIGNLLVKGLPWVIKTLSFVGTVALFLVSGGIFRHNIDFIHDLVHGIPPILNDLVLGLVIGFIVLLLVEPVKRIVVKSKAE